MSKPTILENNLAYWISIAFSPFVILPIIIIGSAWKLAISTQEFLLWAGSALILMSIIPSLYVLKEVRAGRISNLHIDVRQQRLGAFVVFLAAILINIGFYLYIGAPTVLIFLSGLALTAALISGVITIFWKISIHSLALSATLAAYALIIKDPLIWALLLIALPIVIWARIHRKKHTLLQCLVGAILGLVITFVFFALLR